MSKSPASIPQSADPVPVTPPKGRRAPRPQAEAQARQELVLMRSICGAKAKAIAEELNLSVATVKKDLAEARRSNMILAAQEKVLGLVPKAIAALDAHLEAGDKDVALVVLEGLGIIGKHVQISFALPQPGGGTFEEFRDGVIKAKQAGSSQVADGGRERALLGPIIDVEFTASAGPDGGQGTAQAAAV